MKNDSNSSNENCNCFPGLNRTDNYIDEVVESRPALLRAHCYIILLIIVIILVDDCKMSEGIRKSDLNDESHIHWRLFEVFFFKVQV